MPWPASRPCGPQAISMTLSPAPATGAAGLTSAQPLSETRSPGTDARGGRNRSVTSGLASPRLGPGGAGTPEAGQALAEQASGDPGQQTRPRSGRAKVTERLKSRSRGRLSVTAVAPTLQLLGPRPRRPHPLSKADTRCHLPPLPQRPPRPPSTPRQLATGRAVSAPEEQDGAAEHRGIEEAPPTRVGTRAWRRNCREKPRELRGFRAGAGKYAFRRAGRGWRLLVEA